MAAGGLVLGATVLTAIYPGPFLRVRPAPGPHERALVVEGERPRLVRLGDAAAVPEEHGRPGAGELRDEIEFRGRVLRALKRLSEKRP